VPLPAVLFGMKGFKLSAILPNQEALKILAWGLFKQKVFSSTNIFYLQYSMLLWSNCS